MFGQAAGGIIGDYFGWRPSSSCWPRSSRVARVALAIEFAPNPVKPAAAPPEHKARGLIADYRKRAAQPWARLSSSSVFFESAVMFGAFTYVAADLHLRFGSEFHAVGLVVGGFASAA